MDFHTPHLCQFHLTHPLCLSDFPDCHHLRRDDFFSQVKSKVRNILNKDTDLRINLNIAGDPIVSHTHTHSSPGTHWQTSRHSQHCLSVQLEGSNANAQLAEGIRERRQKWCVSVVSLGHTPLTRVPFRAEFAGPL
jgi:hypothetical protein